MGYLWTAFGPVRLRNNEARVKPLLSPRPQSPRPSSARRAAPPAARPAWAMNDTAADEGSRRPSDAAPRERKVLRRERREKRLAQKKSVARLVGAASTSTAEDAAPPEEGPAWDYSLGRACWTAAPVAHPRAPADAGELSRWVVYVLRDPSSRKLGDRARAIGAALAYRRRPDDPLVVVRDNDATPPVACGACVAADAGSFAECPAHFATDRSSFEVPRGAFEVYAMVDGGGAAAPPCPDCGSRAGHPLAPEDYFSADPPRLYRVASRFAARRLPTEATIARRLRRLARAERRRGPPVAADAAVAAKWGNDAGGLEAIDFALDGPSPDLVACAAALRKRGPCALRRLRGDQGGGRNGGGGPSALAAFADRRAALRRLADDRLGESGGDAVALRRAVEAWRADAYAASDLAFVGAAALVANPGTYDGDVRVEAPAEAFALGTPPKPRAGRSPSAPSLSPGSRSVIFLA